MVKINNNQHVTKDGIVKKNPLRKANHRWNDKGWAFSMLSDTQEMIDRDFPKERIIEKINDVKRVLMGKYIEIEDGMMIEVQRPQKILK